jgi:hypothetical protein
MQPLLPQDVLRPADGAVFGELFHSAQRDRVRDWRGRLHLNTKFAARTRRMPVPIARAEALNGKPNCFEKRVCLDFHLVLDALNVPVPDPAERHGRSVVLALSFAQSFRSVLCSKHAGCPISEIERNYALDRLTIVGMLNA